MTTRKKQSSATARVGVNFVRGINELDELTWSDARVQDAINANFVPLKVDVTRGGLQERGGKTLRRATLPHGVDDALRTEQPRRSLVQIGAEAAGRSGVGSECYPFGGVFSG